MARRVGGCPPERLTMQEEIKLTVECLFGANGLECAYERLGVRDHVDQQLDAMEDVELMAVHDHLLEECWERDGDEDSVV